MAGIGIDDEKTEMNDETPASDNILNNQPSELDPEPLKKNDTKKRIKGIFKERYIPFFISVLLLLIVLLVIVNKQLTGNLQGPESVNPVLTPGVEETTSIPSTSGLTPIALEDLRLFYPQKVNNYSGEENYLELFKIGDIIGGDYQGNELYFARFISTAGPCKGPGCGRPQRLRFIKSGDVLIFTPRISSLPSLEGYGTVSITDLLTKNGWNVETNESLTIPVFEYPENLVFSESRLLYRGEEDGKPDFQILKKAFSDSVFGEVYTTNPVFSPQQPFYTDEETPYKSSGGWGGGIYSCVGEECYYTNAFFIFRPDGTYLKYAYIPEMFDSEDKSDLHYQVLEGNLIELNDSKKLKDNYNFYTRMGCSDNEADYISVVSPNTISKDQLITAGRIISTQKPIYFPPSDHQLLKDFHQKYLTMRGEWYYSLNETSPPEDLTYEDFVANTPVFFWEDPFGRLIRFTNRNFVTPFMCEPVIYLYPEKVQEVTVKLPGDMKLLTAIPEYGNVWKVFANAEGKIIDKNKTTYEYLFWEGVSGFWPESDVGYVVERAEVKDFFAEILPKMGLNNKELGDFMDAWLPEFQNAPYYAISFYDQKLIDEKIPLKVMPEPDTLIRILMDYKELKEPVELKAPIITSPPPRKGFTVIEWGGMKR